MDVLRLIAHELRRLRVLLVIGPLALILGFLRHHVPPDWAEPVQTSAAVTALAGAVLVPLLAGATWSADLGDRAFVTMLALPLARWQLWLSRLLTGLLLGTWTLAFAIWALLVTYPDPLFPHPWTPLGYGVLVLLAGLGYVLLGSVLTRSFALALLLPPLLYLGASLAALFVLVRLVGVWPLHVDDIWSFHGLLLGGAALAGSFVGYRHLSGPTRARAGRALASFGLLFALAALFLLLAQVAALHGLWWPPRVAVEAVSQDGSHVAVGLYRGRLEPGKYTQAFLAHQLVVLDLPRRRATVISRGYLMQAALSSHGRRISWMGGHGWRPFVSDTRSPHPREVRLPADLFASDAGIWSPSERYLYLRAYGNLRGWAMLADAQGRLRLTTEVADGFWSRGDVLYLANTEGLRRWQPGQGLTTLSDLAVDVTSASPDGRLLVLRLSEEAGNPSLLVEAASLTPRQELARGKWTESFWSADGCRLALLLSHEQLLSHELLVYARLPGGRFRSAARLPVIPGAIRQCFWQGQRLVAMVDESHSRWQLCELYPQPRPLSSWRPYGSGYEVGGGAVFFTQGSRLFRQVPGEPVQVYDWLAPNPPTTFPAGG